jgi:hypothetical protein
MVLAHAFGQRYDLPIPLLLFIGGGAAIVVVSFLLVIPRAVAPGQPERNVEAVASSGDGRLAGGLIGTLVLALLIACGLAGSQEVSENLLPTVFWLLAWIAVPLTCGLVGDWTRPLNPFAFLARLADRPGLRRALVGGERPVAWRFGWWPAVILFSLAAAGELIFNPWVTVPAHTALCLLVYAVVSAAGGLLFGQSWLERGELFSVLFATWGRLGWFRFGAPGRRGFAGGLDAGFEACASRITFVLLLLVSVNFDGLLSTPSWARFEKQMPGALAIHSVRLEAFRTVTFVILTVAVAALFGAFAVAAARAGRHQAGSALALTGLLPSLLPIAFGYLLVHNLQYVLVNSQLLGPLLGNPVGKDWWPIHLPYPFNDDYEPHPHFLPSAFYWYVAVVVIVAVHVIAVVLAHRHLGRRGTDVRAARASEYPWLVAMVAYTMLSLWLIAQPLVQEKQPAKNSAAAAVQQRV